MAVRIVTDSTAYLSAEEISAYDIRVVSLYIVQKGQSHREIDLDNQRFYATIGKDDALPKSSQPDVAALMAAFDEILANGDDVCGIFISGKLSGTMTGSAALAAQQMAARYPERRIALFDSQSCGMQLGYVALAAAQLAQAGGSLDEVLARATIVRGQSQFVFAPESLHYLKRGGRIGAASALIGNLLQIKPILTVFDGAVIVLEKVRTQKRVLQSIVDIVIKQVNASNGLAEIIVHHINSPETGHVLAEMLAKEFDRPIALRDIGPVVGLHVGPGSVGVVYTWQ